MVHSRPIVSVAEDATKCNIKGNVSIETGGICHGPWKNYDEPTTGGSHGGRWFCSDRKGESSWPAQVVEPRISTPTTMAAFSG